MTSRRARPRLAAAAALVLLALTGAGCASGGNDEGASQGDAGDAEASSKVAPEPADAPAALSERAAAGDSLAYNDDVASAAAQGQPDQPEVEPADSRSLIKKGNVSLESDDVARVRFLVTTLVTSNGGEVAEDSAESDEEGEAERARLTMRVPEDAFSAVMEGLEAIEGAELVSLTTTSQDVTEQVIDTDVRVELQRRSIDRISLLLDRAQSIRDIVNIERELARREADLGSLQKRQAFLADQTSLATINIAIQRPAEKKVEEKKKEEKEEEKGFGAGLSGGWDAFQTVTTGLLTGAGAVLPFAVVGLVIGVPLWALARRRRTPAAPVASDPQSA